tara:strand:+ start:721 stop:1284 length:564 start_codon:yes stop_codon:yes gene_type:complete
MATVMDVLQGISQAVANSYDGSHDERFSADGEARTAGLKREKGDLNIEARVMDGFNVKFYGNRLCIEYHSEMKLKDVHDRNKFENDVNQHIADIAKYLKKEYKKITGNTLSLTKKDESDINVQHMSNIRTWVQARQFYKIGGLDGVVDSQEPESKDRLDKAVRKWLELGKKAPKAKNDTRKKEKTAK